MSEVRVERWVLEANLRHCWDDLITTLKRVEELEGDVREGVKAQSHYNDSLVAVQRERDDLKQRVDYCNKNARREITRLREAAETSIRKCEQYWNEHNIPDAEVHAALELIHGELRQALRGEE